MCALHSMLEDPNYSSCPAREQVESTRGVHRNALGGKNELPESAKIDVSFAFLESKYTFDCRLDMAVEKPFGWFDYKFFFSVTTFTIFFT